MIGLRFWNSHIKNLLLIIQKRKISTSSYLIFYKYRYWKQIQQSLKLGNNYYWKLQNIFTNSALFGFVFKFLKGC